MIFKFKNSSFKTNMMIIFFIYACLFLIVSSYFGYFNTKKLISAKESSLNENIKEELSSISHNLKSDLDILNYTALCMNDLYENEKDDEKIISFLKNSSLFNSIVIMDNKGEGKTFTKYGLLLSNEDPVHLKNQNNIKVNINSNNIQLIKRSNNNKIIIIEKEMNTLKDDFINKASIIIKYNDNIIYSDLQSVINPLETMEFNNLLKEYNIEISLLYPREYYERLSTGHVKYNIISLLLYAFILIILYFLFKKTVYLPIVSIEKAINGLAEGNFDVNLNISKTNEFYNLSEKINSVIKRLKDLINREYSSKILKKQAELNALQSQINPHFLYNTLESIRGLAVCEGSYNIAEMTKALSNLFRYNISQKNNLVTLKEELQNVDNYLTIQQYRFNNKFTVKNIIDSDTYNFRLPKLSIQPIIENAIHHGLEMKKGEGLLTMRAYRTEERLVINVEDNGMGITKEYLEELNEKLLKGIETFAQDESENSKSIGLMNVNERIRLYFGNEFGVRAYSTYGLGTNIEVVLPLVKYDM